METSKIFMSFEVKKDMRMAPVMRKSISQEQKDKMDGITKDQVTFTINIKFTIGFLKTWKCRKFDLKIQGMDTSVEFDAHVMKKC